jgi:hypothetical protein
VSWAGETAGVTVATATLASLLGELVRADRVL